MKYMEEITKSIRFSLLRKFAVPMVETISEIIAWRRWDLSDDGFNSWGTGMDIKSEIIEGKNQRELVVTIALKTVFEKRT